MRWIGAILLFPFRLIGLILKATWILVWVVGMIVGGLLFFLFPPIGVPLFWFSAVMLVASAALSRR